MIDAKKIRESYIFESNLNEEKKIYFCSCGNKIKKTIKKDDNGDDSYDEVKVRTSAYESLDIDTIVKTGTVLRDVQCNHCEKDYKDDAVSITIFPVNEYFLETYSFIEDEENVYLYKDYVQGNFNEKLYEEDTDLKIESVTTNLCFNKKNKLLTYLNKSGGIKEIELNNIIETLEIFFLRNSDNKISDNLIDIHRFVNRMANFVSDSKNFNFVEDILKEMIGKPGIDTLKKSISIFFGIICYPNLSTIALTKSLIFLYDMMNNCALPNTKILSDNNVTSPLKIFNFLVVLEKEKIQADLESEKKDNKEFKYKSKTGKEFLFNFGSDIERLEGIGKGSLVSEKGELRVIEDLKQKEVSKFIFKNIKNFSDYKTLMRYVNIISYEELISLVIKYDVDFLINLLPIVEFRNGINYERLNQIILIARTYLVKTQVLSTIYNRRILLEEREEGAEENDFIFNISKEQLLQYKKTHNLQEDIENEPLLKHMKKHIEINPDLYVQLRWMNFEIYDDSLMMIQTLSWDPNKEFYKIKDIDELISYHDSIMQHFNELSDKEKSDNFRDFVAKFRYLEVDNNNDLKVKLIPEPKFLIKEANDMRNCAGSYVTRISKGQYLLFSVDDISKDRKSKEDKRFMLGLLVSKNGLEFDQVKSAFNRKGTDRFKKQVMRYLEEKDISYRNVADIKLEEDVFVGYVGNPLE